jgi:hypothetical protein
MAELFSFDYGDAGLIAGRFYRQNPHECRL